MSVLYRNRIIIYVAGFLFATSLALTSYINSSFLKLYMSEFALGFVYALASLVSILTMLRMPRILNSWGARKIAFISSLLLVFSFFLLAVSINKGTTIMAFILNALAANFLIASLDIFVEDFSKNHNIGRFRGLYLSITSMAWVVSQAAFGSVVKQGSFYGVYLLASLFMLLTAFVFFFFLREFKDPHYTKTPIRQTVQSFFKNKNIGRIYFINFILKFFLVWMIIYIPIYLHETLGFDWSKIGLMFTIMLTPFVFLSYPLGRLSDKHGEKKLLILGFLTGIIAVVLIPYIRESIFIVWAAILFLSRVGAATIEVMSESYFFKVENEENADAISFFRNTQPLAYLVAPVIASVLLIVIPSFEYLFSILAAVMLVGLYVSFKLDDVK